MKNNQFAAVLACLFGLAGAAGMTSENLLPEFRSNGISYAELSIRGVSVKGFNPLQLTLEAYLKGSVFGTQARDVSVIVNDVSIAPGEVRVADDFLSVQIRLRNGLNEIAVTALDQHGALLAADVLAWAGDKRLVIDVVNRNLQPVENASVELILADDHHVRLRTVTDAGRAEFENLPPETMLLRVRGPGGSLVRTVVEPGQISALINLAEE